MIFIRCLFRLIFEDDGATMLEYAMVATLIAVACVASISPIGPIVAGYLADALKILAP